MRKLLFTPQRECLFRFIKNLHTSTALCADKSKDKPKDKPKAKPPRMKTLSIYRYNPHTPNVKPRMQKYQLDLNQCGPMILDGLIKIKNEIDSSLSFRRSCREGVCGSCAMNIGGTNQLACISKLTPRGVTKIYPLPHMYVVRDLITDFRRFVKQYNSIMPYLVRRGSAMPGDQQYLQSMKDRDKLDGMYECVLCACCSHACPAYWWNGQKFLGPAALLHAFRWIEDSRDEATAERIEVLKGSYPVFKCHTIMECTNACPKHLNPGKAIAKLKLRLAGLTTKSRPQM